MRIERIIIKNYRQYAKIDLEFPKKDHDINIIVGKNGVGKTTFLNAINWCLYREEPHAYSQESALPIRNLSNGGEPVYVELQISADDGSIITFKRKEGHALEGSMKKIDGETIPYRGKDADILVDSFVPQAIREFFFFDGEQLDRYFLDEKTKNIKDNISVLSRVIILEYLDMELSSILNTISRKAGTKNKNINKLNKDKEEKEKVLESEIELRDTAEKNLKETRKELKEINKKLGGIPDIEKLEEDRKQALTEKNEALSEKSRIENERKDLFLLNSPYVFLNSAMEYVLEDIEEKRKNNELPKPIDDEVIKESLEEHVCKVCGQPLDGEVWNELNQTLTTYKMSSKQSKQLQRIGSSLEVNHTKVKRYPKEFEKLKKQYKKAKKDFNKKSEEFKEVDKLYQRYDDDEIREDHKTRVGLESDEIKYDNALSNHKANIIVLKKEISELDTKLNKAMEKDKKTKVYKKKKDFLEEAVELVQYTKEEIIESTRIKIENFTKSAFFDLTWKEGTYKDVKINDDYQVELIHSVTNSNSIGSASAAERELLVLSFTLGVHTISEFDSPLLIDTPLARVSDEHRVNFAKTFIEISKNKQITLLLTPAEYSEEIQELFGKEDILKFEIVMAEDESHSDIQEME